MTNDIKIFENSEFGQIRVVDYNNKSYFIAKDVAEILGYATTEKMTRRLDDDEKANAPIWDISNNQHRNQTVINESGLYNAILGSHKPEAKKFRKWVTNEVLPCIRETGGYIQKDRAIDFVDNWLPQLDEFNRGVIASVLEESRRLRIENKDLINTIELQKDDVEFAKALQVSEDTIRQQLTHC